MCFLLPANMMGTITQKQHHDIEGIFMALIPARYENIHEKLFIVTHLWTTHLEN